MKINIKKISAVFAMLIIALLFTGCKKNEPSGIQTKKASATLVAPTNSNNTGVINVDYNSATKIISYKISWQLSSPTAVTEAIHFHCEEVGSELTIEITGFSTGSSGTISGTIRPLTQAEENLFLAGKWSFYIHSTTGELGGNIKFK